MQNPYAETEISRQGRNMNLLIRIVSALVAAAGVLGESHRHNTVCIATDNSLLRPITGTLHEATLGKNINFI
jgi:hypothetical protein